MSSTREIVEETIYQYIERLLNQWVPSEGERAMFNKDQVEIVELLDREYCIIKNISNKISSIVSIDDLEPMEH